MSAQTARDAIPVHALLDAGPGDVLVRRLAYDSRTVVPGTLFFCVPGLKADGHGFAPDAIEGGATALVVERPLGLGVPEVIVGSARRAMAIAAARFHGHPTRTLDVAGITGTNGKTTTAYLLRELLEAGGRSSGLLSTVEAIVGGRSEPAVRTTPEAIDLQARFHAMLDAGDEVCSMEVSSHALSLRRVDETRFAAATFTNLTRDHLDFHHSMDEYFAAKARLFELVSGPSIINVDDAHGRRLAADLPDALTYAVARPADFRARDVAFDLAGARFTVVGPDGPFRVDSPLAGPFNVLNVLAAVATAAALGVPRATIEAALPAARPVSGRLEAVDEGQPFDVVVDYAHNPDSLERVLTMARGLTDGRLHCVFGCTGDRDRGKRPLMAEIACTLADRVVVTTDDPFSEDPDTILDDIMAGVDDSAERIDDRRAAFAHAIASARPADTVVIAGRGHHEDQVLAGGRTRPFHDASVAAEELRAAGHRRSG